MLLIGSAALTGYLKNNNLPPCRKKLLDIDYIASPEDHEAFMYLMVSEIKEEYLETPDKQIVKLQNGNIIEIEIAREGSSGADLLEMVHTHPELFTKSSWTAVALLDVLYTIKMSHRYKRNSPHFWKTRRDIMMMREIGAKIPECLTEWFKKRESETYTYLHPKLSQNKEEFFTDAVGYLHWHDDLHEAVKHMDTPAYAYYAKDDQPVLSDMKKFMQVDEKIRLYGALEEILVLAAERSCIPFGVNPDKAFRMSYSKLASSISSGVFRSYVYENWEAIEALYLTEGHTYMDRINKEIANGNVRTHEQGILELKEIEHV
jgi:hypothetical protein